MINEEVQVTLRVAENELRDFGQMSFLFGRSMFMWVLYGSLMGISGVANMMLLSKQKISRYEN